MFVDCCNTTSCTSSDICLTITGQRVTYIITILSLLYITFNSVMNVKTTFNRCTN